jgi:hypothetical protein
MTRFALRFAATAASVALGVVLAPSASAAPTDAVMYGQHVPDCAQSMGFDQDHNPGEHRGISMWDPAHTC